MAPPNTLLKNREREILIWLVGLISTDGCIHKLKRRRHGRYTITISSSENDWLELIQARLKEIGLTSRITSGTKGRAGYLYIHKVRNVVGLLQQDFSDFMSPRKWKQIQKVCKYYKTARILSRKKGDLYRCCKCKRWKKKEKFHNRRDFPHVSTYCKKCSKRRDRARYWMEKEPRNISAKSINVLNVVKGRSR